MIKFIYLPVICFIAIGCSNNIKTTNKMSLVCNDKVTLSKNKTSMYIDYVIKYGETEGEKLYYQTIKCILIPSKAKVKILKEEAKYTKVNIQNQSGWMFTNNISR